MTPGDYEWNGNSVVMEERYKPYPRNSDFPPYRLTVGSGCASGSKKARDGPQVERRWTSTVATDETRTDCVVYRF